MKSTGIISYGPSQRAVINVDEEIANYYRSLIPKYITYNKPRWNAHISLVRHYESPSDWNVCDGYLIDFEYFNEIEADETYLWLNVSCPELEFIREQLGLSPRPPWRNYFHITLGNFKGLK